MSILFRVEDEPRHARVECFRQIVAESIVPFGVCFERGQEVRAEIVSGVVGPVQVTRVSAPRLTAVRDVRLIRACDPELMKIDVQLCGRTVFAQGGREAVLAAGDLTLVDLSRPCRLADRDDGHQVLAVMFPRTALPLPDNELERLTAVAISGRGGLGAPISSLARHLARQLQGYDPTAGARLAAALMDLLVVALAQRLDRVSRIAPDTRRRALLASVQSFIEHRLGDPALSPSAIAAAHHVSLRYLHKLFEQQGTSVGRWIRERRLERCRRDLLDPAHRDLPASAIAFGWGFADAAHFSRVFRAAYGLPPATYRRLRRQEPPPLA
jgi:AraC-like DNA-binding protein